MSSIFISYSYNDFFAREIVNALQDMLSEKQNIICADKMPIEYDISQRIVEAINKCTNFICIFNGVNPNTMFELGYALGKNKNIILIGEYNDIPYDLKDYNYIKKGNNINEILIELNKRLKSDVFPERNSICYSAYKDNILKIIDEQHFLDNISYQDFEQIIYEYLKAQNLFVEPVMQSRDTGYDFYIQELNCIVEVKKYSRNSKVSISVMRSLLGTMIETNADKCIIISSSEFTRSAISFVQRLEQEIILLTVKDLLNLDGDFISIFK